MCWSQKVVKMKPKHKDNCKFLNKPNQHALLSEGHLGDNKSIEDYQTNNVKL